MVQSFGLFGGPETAKTPPEVSQMQDSDEDAMEAILQAAKVAAAKKTNDNDDSGGPQQWRNSKQQVCRRKTRNGAPSAFRTRRR